MNNMFEYLAGGQCYTCGGKVRYDDGGQNMQQQQSPIADMSGQAQQRPQASTIDANAKQLMTFLLDQLSKGTSERILKRTLIDSGLKSEQASQLLEVAKQEFDKSVNQGDYSTEAEDNQIRMQAQQQQMGQMQQAGPNAGMDPSMMAMDQNADQSQVADSEMQQASFGGFFSNNNARRLKNKKNVVNIIYNINGEPIETDEFGNPLLPDAQSMVAPEQLYNPGMRVSGDIFNGGNAYTTTPRMNMGGTCPAGYEWNDTTGSCVPSTSTINTMKAGSGPVNIGGNPAQTQASTKQTTDAYNKNITLEADAQDKQRNAEMGYYDKLLNTGNAKNTQRFDNSMAAMGAFHQQMLNGQLPFQQKQVQPPLIPGVNANPTPNQGTTQDFGTTTNARFGGLARFVGGGMKQYGAGGTEDGCPVGYYKGPDGDCLKIFGSDQSQKQFQEYQNWYGKDALAPGMSRAAPLSQEEWNKENPAQDQMAAENKKYAWDQGAAERKQKFQGYLDWHNKDAVDPGMNRAAPQTYDEWEKENYEGQNPNAANNAANNNNNANGAPIDPRLTNSPYIVRTDKNKIANLDNNWVNKALAVGSNLGSAQTLGATGAFGPYLQMLLGATGAVSSAALGAKKIFAGTKRTVYDDKGNVFEYDNKRSYKDAGRGDSQNQGTPGSGNIADTGVNEDIPKGSFMKTSTDKYGQSQGIGRNGELVSYDNPMRNAPRREGTDEEGNPIMGKYDDQDRLNDMLEFTGKTQKDFRSQGPALFGENKYGSKEELQQDYEDAGFFGKMRQRNQFKRDAMWSPDLSKSTEVDELNKRTNPPAEDPAVVKRDGGQWNPFVDNRRKLRITMPMYGGGGPINNETTPYTQQEWAQVQSKTFPLKPEDIQPYNDYVAGFNTTAGTNSSNLNIAGTSNANNALSANPNANMVDTKEVTVDRGDELGARVAQNLYSGLAGWNAGLNEIQGNKRMKQIQKKRQDIGNSMEISAVNPINMYGSWQANANQGSNYDLANQGATQDWQTTLNAKFGGTKYRRGGTYQVSPEELRAIIAMGGEVEFLD